ncbi:phage tail protein [Sphingomonas sp. KR1UV-12]|uniref:Phage tail protein n=1 Tax=Sphingomonas aurea TaxID=3063994 RepID=A0ABT9ELU5_9SPHN|nr:phage tail protein [Sphingomonas sp. KR1UV-12]MDP1027781.1 phage tail protein [Sphingomonas sp. KR1UV-12]
MATLVLSAIGTAVGGPLGGAIGGLIGNALDHRLLGRKGREGPRLTELAMQTSSYGTPIPMLFGTMRVAGTVIWSTDLKEARGRSGGGKGQAATTTYSYSASFAVLLSARPIVGIGRIWADGRLVRGSAGDLKVKATLRVHTGSEDQAVDPLIASAEGTTPAYRGMAYLVWEDLPLADFGNRLPQLTVEVIADAGPAPVGAIAAWVADEVRGGGGATLDGFAASGSVGGVLEVLAQAGSGWWAPAGGALSLRDDAGAAAVLADRGVVASGLKGASRARQVAAIETVPQGVAVGHYDPARDYQAGVQRATRVGAGAGVERVEMPAAMTATAARALAEALLVQAGAARVRRTVTLGFDGMAVAPGAVVAIADEAGRWQVTETNVEAMATRLTLVPLPPAIAATGAVDGGRVAGALDAPVGATLLRVAELPVLDDTLTTAPRLTVLAAGQGAGWRSASLLWSADDGASWTPAGATAAPAVLGTVETAPRPAPACLYDTAGVLVVRLARADMMLADADDAALDRGTNLAMAGGELVQFGQAVPLGGGRWRLTRLLRGRRGTEAAAVAVGDGFALLTAESASAIELPLSALGRMVRVMASGAGDVEPAEVAVVATGASLRPPAPVQAVRRGDGGLGWTRRSRAGWTWRDGGDVPLGEEAERYRLTVTPPGGAAVQLDLDRPWLAGPLMAGTMIEVRQRGTWADSLPLVTTI